MITYMEVSFFFLNRCKLHVVARLVPWIPYCLSGIRPLRHISCPLAMPANAFGSVIGKYGDFGFVVMVIVARCPTHKGRWGHPFPTKKAVRMFSCSQTVHPYMFIHLFSRISFDV